MGRNFSPTIFPRRTRGKVERHAQRTFGVVGVVLVVVGKPSRERPQLNESTRKLFAKCCWLQHTPPSQQPWCTHRPLYYQVTWRTRARGGLLLTEKPQQQCFAEGGSVWPWIAPTLRQPRRPCVMDSWLSLLYEMALDGRFFFVASINGTRSKRRGRSPSTGRGWIYLKECVENWVNKGRPCKKSGRHSKN